MLDIEITTPPTQTALDIVSLNDLASHLRLSPHLRANADMQLRMTSALHEVVDSLHGFDGTLNRMVLPCTVTRYLTKFPAKGKPILLPYPDLIALDSITIAATSTAVASSSYVVKKPLVPEVWAIDGWPDADAAPRAIAIRYRAGYAAYPEKLKRLIKIMSAHNLQNLEATINEPRQMAINRKVEFAHDYLLAQLRVPVAFDDWGE
jgi:hypothetical protein